jgi:hypothetical protein
MVKRLHSQCCVDRLVAASCKVLIGRTPPLEDANLWGGKKGKLSKLQSE